MIFYCITITLIVIKRDIPIYLFYNSAPYLKFGIFIRGFNFIMAFVISILLFKFTSNKQSFFTKIGQNSLWIYLGHTYFISGIKIVVKYFI